MNIYQSCPMFEKGKLIIRQLKNDDCDDLLKVYSDKNALPFFNSDGCDGDNFYYPTRERMAMAIDFWNMAYENGWFVRFSIVDKAVEGIIGMVELCLRVSEDAFHHMGILRVDVRSDYEKEDTLYDIFSLITPEIESILGCRGVVTKAPAYAVDRINAIKKVGFAQADDYLIGKTGYAYDGYWTIKPQIADHDS